MGQCHGKNISIGGGKGRHRRRNPRHLDDAGDIGDGNTTTTTTTPLPGGSGHVTPIYSSSCWPSPYTHGSASPFPAGVSPSPTSSTPRRFFRRPFPPPSPAKHIKAALAKRLDPGKAKDGTIAEDGTGNAEKPTLNKNFGYGKNFGSKYELGKEVGRGHFGNTCLAKAKKGDIKGQTVAVKIIPKAKVRRFHKFPIYRHADERLNDIVGSAYYVAPEVLHKSYSTEADMWSIGVIVYILLCGSRPFWARTESGIFRSVLRADPNFDDTPWPAVSPEAKDFVKRLLNKDYRKRLTAAQALSKLLVRSNDNLVGIC
ncbi:hypothetical protein BHE74_00045290 [Ensete ventricosum]|nr:hypothetical protein BHE74_00045290 [Ensete ventricosum]